MRAKSFFWLAPLVMVANVCIILGLVYGAVLIAKHVWGN